MAKNTVNRRDFLRLAVLGVGTAALAACGQPTPEKVIEKVVETVVNTQVVEKEVEKKVVETVVSTQLVEKEVEKQVVVTATPEPTLAPTPAPVVEVTITTTGWPVDLKSADDIKADPTNAAYAAAVQAWLDKNPGVTLKKVDVPIWDTQAIQANVAGGTDCTYLFGPCVGGGWGEQEAKNAFVQGMLADITPMITKYELQKKCLDYLWNSWNGNTSVLGRYYAYPLNEYAPDAGTLVYRKDLITAKGLKAPVIGWTWAEAGELFKGLTDSTTKVSGLGAPTWFMSYHLAMHGWDILTQIPQPKENWHWTLDITSDTHWVDLIKAYRKLLFEDKAIYSDVALGGGDTEYVKLFRAGTIAMGRFNFWSMFGAPSASDSFAAFADELGKPYQDVFSVVSLPTGDGYQLGSGVNVSGGCAFSPNQTADAWDKGVGLIDWMFWDKGLDMTKKGIWDIAKDPRSVFSAFLYMSGKQGYEGVSGSAADAWGQEIIDRWTAIGKLPVEPTKALHYPAEQNPSPSNQPIDDQFSLLSTNPGNVDVAGMLKKGEDDWKQAIKGFSSSIGEQLFTASSKKYYAALDEYLKTSYPDFYQNRFKPFFEKNVAPNIS